MEQLLDVDVAEKPPVLRSASSAKLGGLLERGGWGGGGVDHDGRTVFHRSCKILGWRLMA